MEEPWWLMAEQRGWWLVMESYCLENWYPEQEKAPPKKVVTILQVQMRLLDLLLTL